MSGLELNKVSAAVLVAAIVAMVTGFAADGLYHPKEPEKRGYSIDVPEVAEEGDAAPVDDTPVNILAYLQEADVEAGKALTKKCTACHNFEKGGANKVGPALYGIIGRDIASSSGFAYSQALQDKEGSWEFQNLSQFLLKPKLWAPGTKMAYAGMKKPEQRGNLIAYLNTLAASPKQIPAYTAPAEDAEPAGSTDAESIALEEKVTDDAVVTEPEKTDAQQDAEESLSNDNPSKVGKNKEVTFDSKENVQTVKDALAKDGTGDDSRLADKITDAKKERKEEIND